MRVARFWASLLRLRASVIPPPARLCSYSGQPNQKVEDPLDPVKIVLAFAALACPDRRPELLFGQFGLLGLFGKIDVCHWRPPSCFCPNGSGHHATPMATRLRDPAHTADS